MTEWFVGTMGYGYDDWKNVFYPPHARPGSYLRWYAKIFNAVELDTTFYGIPPKKRVLRWRDQAPQGFMFCPKTPREITHSSKLDSSTGEMRRFIASVRAFGPHLGPILLQFPPDWEVNQLGRLEKFADTLPEDLSFAFEFRHVSWNRPAVRAWLARKRLGWVSTEYIIMPKELVRTAEFIYIRFIGRHGRYDRKDRVRRDVSPILANWLQQIRAQLDDTLAVFAFFNNDFSGHSPATANAFKQQCGLPINEPEIPRQGRLF